MSKKSTFKFRILFFLLLITGISSILFLSHISRVTTGSMSPTFNTVYDALFPFYWFSIGAFIGGLILLFSPAALQKKFTGLVLWWIPITVAIIVLFNSEPSGGKFGISFPDPFAPEPLALFSGILLSLTLTVRLVTYWIKKALKK